LAPTVAGVLADSVPSHELACGIEPCAQPVGDRVEQQAFEREEPSRAALCLGRDQRLKKIGEWNEDAEPGMLEIVFCRNIVPMQHFEAVEVQDTAEIRVLELAGRAFLGAELTRLCDLRLKG